jgi:CheY-like chemotaxis protein
MHLLVDWLMDTRRVMRLLVVEDSPAYQYLIRDAFRKLIGGTRWAITIARDGEEALRLLFDEEYKDSLPDLILLDWNLPRIGGEEVLTRAKEHPKLRKIPILIFSSSESDDDVHSAYGAHANGFFLKPADQQGLIAIAEGIELFWTAIVRLPKAIRW